MILYDDLKHTYMYIFVGKIQQNHHFSVRNTCMKHKFGNFTYEYYLKGKLSGFVDSFWNSYCIIYTKVMTN
jgi:hypothetical protein